MLWCECWNLGFVHPSSLNHALDGSVGVCPDDSLSVFEWSGEMERQMPNRRAFLSRLTGDSISKTHGWF